MKRWKEYPLLLIRRCFLLFLAGTACILVGAAGFLASEDRILLGLSIVLCIGSVWKGILLWKLIKENRYDTVTGVCVGISLLPLRRYKKVRVMDANGIEGTLMLNKKESIQIGFCYCFFFRRGSDDILTGAGFADWHPIITWGLKC